MRRVLIMAVVGATFSLAAPAAAAVTLSTTTGKPLDWQIYGVQEKKGANPVYGTSPKNNSPINVTYTGNSNMLMANGFAQIDDATPKSPALNTLIINPDLLFSDMKFAVQLTQGGSVQVYYLLAGSGLDPNAIASYTTTCPTCSFSSDKKDNTNYLITGGVFDGIMLKVLTPSTSTTATNLFEFKQNSYNQAVPEPATWAMMLLGFGGIGMTMRRRRRNNALMQVA